MAKGSKKGSKGKGKGKGSRGHDQPPTTPTTPNTPAEGRRGTGRPSHSTSQHPASANPGWGRGSGLNENATPFASNSGWGRGNGLNENALPFFPTGGYGNGNGKGRANQNHTKGNNGAKGGASKGRGEAVVPQQLQQQGFGRGAQNGGRGMRPSRGGRGVGNVGTMLGIPDGERVIEIRQDKDETIRKILDAFIASELMSYEFTKLNPGERRWLHSQCDIHSLQHKSHGPQDARIMTVSKAANTELDNEDIYQDQDFALTSSTTSREMAAMTVDSFLNTGIFERPVFDISARASRKRRAFLYRDADKRAERPPAPDKSLDIVPDLPATKARKTITAALKSRVVVISGETGSGKSTQVPKIVLDSGSVEGLIIVTQPRRISATSVARRVAQERRCDVGGEVGYHVRFERLAGPKTKLLFVTTGVLLRMLQSEPEIAAVGCVIVDEVHERDADTDFCLMILKQLLNKRKAFKLLLMSATISKHIFVDYFSAYKPSVVAIEGRTFPVHQMFLEEVLKWVGISGQRVNDKNLQQAEKLLEGEKGDEGTKTLMKTLAKQGVEAKVDQDLVRSVITKIVTDPKTRPSEAILVFLPGWKEISSLKRQIEASTSLAPKVIVMRCHSDMKPEEQNRVFSRPPRGLHKVVLATNIAETSITIPDVVHVIDTAVAKCSSYQSASDIRSLDSVIVSKANLQQRKGRAGRIQSGRCYTLLSSAHYRNLDDATAPELTRIPLHQTCLQLTSLMPGVDVRESLHTALDPPAEEAITNAISFLQKQGALTADQKLTNMGQVLAMLPVDPLVGKLLLYGAAFRVLQPTCIIAAFLSVKSPFVKVSVVDMPDVMATKRRFGRDEFSDHTMMLHTYQEWLSQPQQRRRQFCDQNFLDHTAMMRVHRTVAQFQSIIASSGFLRGSQDEYNKYSGNTGLVRGVVFAGLYPNVAWVGQGRSVKTGKLEGVKVMTLDGKPVGLSKDSAYSNVPVAELARLNLSYVAYYERIFLGRSLVLGESTMFGPVPLLLFATNVTWVDSAEATSAVIEGQWRRLHMPKADAQLLQNLRHLVAFFFRKALERVDASVMPDKVVRSFAEVIGSPIGGGEVTYYDLELSSEDEDAADEPQTEYFATCFVGSDDSDSDDDGPAFVPHATAQPQLPQQPQQCPDASPLTEEEQDALCDSSAAPNNAPTPV